MSTFTLKQGDTSPAIETVLKTPSGSIVDLEDANVSLRMKLPKSNEVVLKDAFKDEKQDGMVWYPWDKEDTQETGLMQAEWVVEFAPDDTPEEEYDIETYPNVGWIDVYIHSRIKADNTED